MNCSLTISSFLLIKPKDSARVRLSGKKLDQDGFHIISDLAKNWIHLGGTGCLGGIGKTDMGSDDPAERQGTLFIGIAAEGNDVIKLLPGKFFQVLGPVMGNIDPDFFQHLYRRRIDI